MFGIFIPDAFTKCNGWAICYPKFVLWRDSQWRNYVCYNIDTRRDRINCLRQWRRRCGTSTPYEQTYMLRKMVLSNGVDGGGKVNSKQHTSHASSLFKDLLMTIVMYRSSPQDQNHRRYSDGRPSSHTGSKSIHILRYEINFWYMYWLSYIN